jgi:hypothetical protein
LPAGAPAAASRRCEAASPYRGRIEDAEAASSIHNPRSAIHLRHRSLFRVHSWLDISRKESALRGRIALPCEEEVTSSSIRNPLSTIGNLAGFVSIRVHSWFEISPKKDRAVLQRRGLNFCSN